MSDLRYTRVSDGPSDRSLMPHLTWALRQHVRKTTAIQAAWADLRTVHPRPKGLQERIELAIRLYPCELLFVHRDAEKENPERRIDEIRSALAEINCPLPAVVCVVPVRMQEAWLLFDERAIRTAAGNPNGSVALRLPRIADLERIADPKELLRSLLKEASEMQGRRLKKLKLIGASQRVAELIDDFSPLRVLSAFTAMEQELGRTIAQNHWS